MKTLTNLVFAALFIASSASAQLIIYKGTLKASLFGQNLSGNINSGFYLIVDYGNTNVAEIEYTSVRGSKFFSSDTDTNIAFVEMSGPSGKSQQAISHPANQCDINEGDTTDGVLAAGTPSLLTLGTNSTVTFPKMLSGGGSAIDSSSGQPTIIRSSVTVSFNSAETLTSNGNGESADAAVTRITAALETQGYLPSGKSERKMLGKLLKSLR